MYHLLRYDTPFYSSRSLLGLIKFLRMTQFKQRLIFLMHSVGLFQEFRIQRLLDFLGRVRKSLLARSNARSIANGAHQLALLRKVFESHLEI